MPVRDRPNHRRPLGVPRAPTQQQHAERLARATFGRRLAAILFPAPPRGGPVTWRRGQGPGNQRGWHDEWRVTGYPGGDHEAVDTTWSSTDPRWPDGAAEVAARTYVLTVLEDDNAPPWEVPPTLRHRRIYTGQYENVDVQPRPKWRRPANALHRTGARP
jgi:hypothetical protein